MCNLLLLALLPLGPGPVTDIDGQNLLGNSGSLSSPAALGNSALGNLVLLGAIDDSGNDIPRNASPIPSALNKLNIRTAAPAEYEHSSIDPQRPGQAAIRISNGAQGIFRHVQIRKHGSVHGKNDPFLNCAISIQSGGHLLLQSGSIDSNARGACAICAQGSQSLCELQNLRILCRQADSPGLRASQGVPIKAQNLRIQSQGYNSAGINLLSQATLEANGLLIQCTGPDSPALHLGQSSARLNYAELQSSQSSAILCQDSNSNGYSKAQIRLENSSLRSQGQPCILCQNSGAEISLSNSSNSGSAILLQSENNNDAAINLKAEGSQLNGRIINSKSGSAIRIQLIGGSQWQGSSPQAIDLSLDTQSSWTATADSRIGRLRLSDGSPLPDSLLPLLRSKGCDILYNSSENPQLQGKSYPLQGGGELRPDAP